MFILCFELSDLRFPVINIRPRLCYGILNEYFNDLISFKLCTTTNRDIIASVRYNPS